MTTAPNHSNNPEYRCPERERDPDAPCSHEDTIEASERYVTIGDARNVPPYYYNPHVTEDPAKAIAQAVIAHSGTMQGIAKLDEHLSAHIRKAVAPETGYPEADHQFNRQDIHKFIEENMGTMVFITCW